MSQPGKSNCVSKVELYLSDEIHILPNRRGPEYSILTEYERQRSSIHDPNLLKTVFHLEKKPAFFQYPVSTGRETFKDVTPRVYADLAVSGKTPENTSHTTWKSFTYHKKSIEMYLLG